MKLIVELQSSLGVFLRDRTIFDFFFFFFFFGRRPWHYVCNTRMCTQKISYFHVFFEKGHLSLPAQGKNIMFSGGKIPSFQIIQEISCPGAALFEKTIFLESLKKILYFCVTFWERSSFIFRLCCKIIFSGKRNMIFLDNTRKVIFQCNFWESPLFQDVWKKKIWFSMFLSLCN